MKQHSVPWSVGIQKRRALSREDFDALVENTVRPIFKRLKSWCKEEECIATQGLFTVGGHAIVMAMML